MIGSFGARFLFGFGNCRKCDVWIAKSDALIRKSDLDIRRNDLQIRKPDVQIQKRDLLIRKCDPHIPRRDVRFRSSGLHLRSRDVRTPSPRRHGESLPSCRNGVNGDPATPHDRHIAAFVLRPHPCRAGLDPLHSAPPRANKTETVHQP